MSRDSTDLEVALGWVVVFFAPPIVAVVLALDILRRHVEWWVLRWDVAICPRGHAVELRGGWKCACGMSYAGHGFDICPHCRAHAHGIMCPCGVTVASPLSPMRGWR